MSVPGSSQRVLDDMNKSRRDSEDVVLSLGFFYDSVITHHLTKYRDEVPEPVKEEMLKTREALSSLAAALLK